MTRDEMGTEVVKTDGRGRMRFTAARRRELLEQYDQSGLSGPKFAVVTGLKYQTLAAWLQKRRRQRDALAPAVSANQEPAVRWLETVIEQAQATPAAATLLVRLPSGATWEVANVSQASAAAALLRAWETPSPRPPC